MNKFLQGIWLFLLLAPSSYAADWTQFRGPDGTGSSEVGKIPLKWSESENITWKIPQNGSSWSQPVVLGNLVFLTSAESEKAIKPKNFAQGTSDLRSMGLPGKKPSVKIDWKVQALDLTTGEMKWSYTTKSGIPEKPIHPSNSWATETPVVDENGVYAFFGATGMLVGVSHKGDLLWRKEFGAFPFSVDFGSGSSPALFDGKIYLQFFNEKSAFLVCVDAKTGDEKWRVDRPKAGSSWASPIIWKTKDRSEVIASGQELISAHNPENGEEYWRAGGIKVPGASSVTADENGLYFGLRSPFSSGPLYALKPGANGDQSPLKRSGPVQSQIWAEKGSAPGMASPLAHRGRIYSLNDNILVCHEALTGKLHYKQRIPLGMIAASPVAAGDRILLLDEDGKGLVLEASDTYQELGGGQIDDVVWATPAITENGILIRGVNALYSVGPSE